MKVLKSQFHGENKPEIDTLPQKKITLFFNNNPTSEGIWVAIDKDNGVMYLLNHAIGLLPYPSWGMELSIDKLIDNEYFINLNQYNGFKSIFCNEFFESNIEFIKEDNMFDIELFIEYQQKLIKSLN